MTATILGKKMVKQLSKIKGDHHPSCGRVLTLLDHLYRDSPKRGRSRRCLRSYPGALGDPRSSSELETETELRFRLYHLLKALSCSTEGQEPTGLDGDSEFNPFPLNFSDQDAARSLGWTEIPGPGGNPEEKKKKSLTSLPVLARI